MDTATIAETMERDIARLKAARPHLGSRIERAEHILVTQLSTSNGSRPVKIRVHADGSHSYTVRSGSRFCRSYRVDPEAWGCSCPDHRRRRAACKHALACWVLERAYRPSPEPLGSGEGECSGCGGRFASRELTELHEDNHDDLTYFGPGLLKRRQACYKLDKDDSGLRRPSRPHGQCCGQHQVVVVALSPVFVGIMAG